MPGEWERACAQVNRTRYQPGQRSGHYESFFLRANHPTRPLAFWIRYTIFSPAGRPAEALGELWAVCFDGESNRHVAVKKEVPLASCRFDRTQLGVEIDGARLDAQHLSGTAATHGQRLAWELTFAGQAAPVFFLPLRLYESKLPSAKVIVSRPLAVFDGRLSVEGRDIDVGHWVGSQNHNWGRKHTDEYAWGQVAGFDTHADSFLEVGTARLKIGPLWTPSMTLLVLRHRGEEFALNGLRQALRAKGRFEIPHLAPGAGAEPGQVFTLAFATETERVRIEGTLCAPRAAFVGLRYYNPPGGTKDCLNTKIAACQLTFTDKRSGRAEILATRHRAALEMLTDDRRHGVPIRA
jgi:hypothetical protein